MNFKSKNIPNIPKPNLIRGVGLIEVLVSILVLGVGALGVASMQLTGLKFSTGSQGRSQAIFIASDIMDRMTANRDIALTGNDYAIATFSGSADVGVPAVNCYSATCTPVQLADFDLYYFLLQVEQTMPFGRATISSVQVPAAANIQASAIYTVTLQWRNVANRQNREGFTADNGLELSTFVFTSAI